MNKIKIGVIREGKVPPDFRVPLTPKQCAKIKATYNNVDVVVQKSSIRAFPDAQYAEEGIELVDSLNSCDIIIGVKEVNTEDLIENKSFMFFSHTYKKQPYNRSLLQSILSKNIRLIDYEVLKDKRNVRLLGFGRYAGIVGCYNAFLTFGLKHSLYNLKAANKCDDRKEVEKELKKVVLPKKFKCVLTGYGRVGHGAREILSLLPIKEVSYSDYLEKDFDEPVFTQLEVNNYYQRKDGSEFIKQEFYKQPELFDCVFSKYTTTSDMYIPCHYWSDRAAYILTKEALKNKDLRISVVADISCDIDGPIASTIRPSKVKEPIYGYNPHIDKEVDYLDDDAVAVMAVDNLPCELPKDASEDFGNELIKHIIPCLLGEDPDQIIHRASQTTLNGKLNEPFLYLEDYVANND